MPYMPHSITASHVEAEERGQQKRIKRQNLRLDQSRLVFANE
jgi:hypothetical protein